MALDIMMKNGENDDKVHFILYIFVFFCGERWRRVGKREGFFDLEGKGIARRPGQGTDQRSCLPSKVLTLRSLFVFFFPGHLKRHKRRVSIDCSTRIPADARVEGEEEREFLTDEKI